MTDNKLQVYKNAWLRLKNEVLNEKNGWGKEDLKKRMNEVLLEEMERYL